MQRLPSLHAPPEVPAESDYATDPLPAKVGLGVLGTEYSETELDGAAAAAGGGPRRTANIYAGPSDRANPAAREYIKNQGFSFPTQMGMPRSGSTGNLRYPQPPPPADTRGAVVAGMGSPALLLGGMGPAQPQPLPVGLSSYPAPLVAGMPPPPAPNATITTADAMANEGRMIEDAAIHDSYVRVITPEAAPTEETEEVCSMLWQATDMRRRWLFRPLLGPEELAHLPEVAAPGELLGSDPLAWRPMVRSVLWGVGVEANLRHRRQG